MPLSQSISFLYNTQDVGRSAERIDLSGPLVLTALNTWKFKDNLSKLLRFEVSIFKDHIDLSKIFLERDVFIPGFEFRGIITELVDVDDSLLKIVMHEKGWHLTRRLYKIADSLKEYTISLTSPASFTTFLQPILDSANTDPKLPFTWALGEDIPATSTFKFNIKWKSYYELLRLVAINSVNDLWFENNKIFIGTKGKSINLDRDDKIYQQLSTRIDLDTYANIIHVVGAEVSGTNVHATQTNTETELLYDYEKVVSNNNLKDQAAVNSVVSRVLSDFDSVEPDVTIGISVETINKYDMRSGDIIKITTNNSTQTVKGFYRLIEIILSDTTGVIKLQFSKTGKFIPRITDTLDILAASLSKIHDIELNS